MIHIAGFLYIAFLFQQFTNVGGVQTPNLGGFTEAAKFGDLDLDGDLDLVYANGGDGNNQQSRLLVNQGNAQNGAIGFYVDTTASQLGPNIAMSTRDVQAVDMDNDGDLDLLFANHSGASPHSNVIFINQGLAQGGTPGVFQLDMSRYVGIGAAGSSVNPAQKIVTGTFAGGFQDWSSQCDFADVDLDGDMDMYHSSYGFQFNALVMSRLFMNETVASQAGFFREYNPSLAVSPAPNLNANSPAGFIEGLQQDNTTNTAGAFHDITNMAIDLEFADLDHDFDVDVFANSRDTRSRFYMNRFVENGANVGHEAGGARLYRDVTATWGLNVSNIGSNYDAELNDLDNDNDVDGYFVNYIGSLTDGWGLNDGTGVVGALAVVPVSSNDDTEVDFIDYDQDGDLDAFISAFANNDRFYKNQFVETGSVNYTQVSIAFAPGFRSLAADVGDMDNDGDFDIISAEDAGVNEVLLKNHLNIPEGIAPRVSTPSALAAGFAQSTARRVIAQAFDNTNFEHFRHAAGLLNFTVNGFPHSAPASWSGGNLWRAEIPGYWFGNITYSFAITDRAGNTGSSPPRNVQIAEGGFSHYGSATVGCQGVPRIGPNSAPTINNPEFTIQTLNGQAGTVGLLVIGDAQGTGASPHGLPAALWVDLVYSTELIFINLNVDGGGAAAAPLPIANDPTLIAKSYFAQAFFLDGSCAAPISATAGLQFTILP